MDLKPSARELDELQTALQASPLPRLPARYFYDDHGAALFDRITGLPEYYQTRTELSILRAHADDVVAACRPTELVELGSGAGVKIHLLLDAMERRGLRERVRLVDVNQQWLDDSAARLRADYPDLVVETVVADFTRRMGLSPAPARLVLLLAGTFGNLHPEREAPALLARVRASLDAEGAPDRGGFLVGLDLVKDPAVLEAAYNDAAGVTAAFNRNMLAVLNARFDAGFDLDAWEHVAFYDTEHQWIEMRLRATRPTSAAVAAVGWARDFAPGDELRTELSCKYTRPRIGSLADAAGLAIAGWWTDPEERFALCLLQPC